MYFFRGAIPVAAFAAPCHPWGLLNPIHGIQNSEKTHFSYGLFLTSSYLKIVVYFYFCWRGGRGRLGRRWLFERFGLKGAFVSGGLFLTSSCLNLVVYFYFCWCGGMGRHWRRWLFEGFAFKGAFVFLTVEGVFLGRRRPWSWKGEYDA